MGLLASKLEARCRVPLSVNVNTPGTCLGGRGKRGKKKTRGRRE